MARKTTAKNTASPWGGARRKRENQFSEKRDAVFDTAARLFRERGFDDTSLNEIAEILNITKPTVYYYVRSKDDLLYEIKVHAQQQVLEALREAEALDASGLERLRTAMIRYGMIMTTDYGVCLAVVPARHMEEENRRRFFVGVEEANSLIERIVKAGHADGSLAKVDSKLVLRALFGSLNWIGMWFRSSGRLSPRALVEQQVDLLLDGVHPR